MARCTGSSECSRGAMVSSRYSLIALDSNSDTESSTRSTGTFLCGEMARNQSGLLSGSMWRNSNGVFFSRNAIAEYLDETIAPRLHPEDPVLRAVNRAWTDYVPTFSENVTGCAYADDEAEYNESIATIPATFDRLERALEKQGAGPFFNGAKYSLVDAGYAPFLQRYFFLDRIRPIGLIGKYPRLKAWADTLMKRPSTHSFPEPEFEALYRLNVKRRNKWISQFIADVAVAAE